MIEILYYAFIFPLQSVLGFALESLFGIIKSYGLSIIFLSLIINLILLKLSKIAEAKAHKTNALKARCDSKIAEFKRVFKGAELQSYIRTLYKQRHYHPIFALSALGGLALQVPFFIAILFLLQDFEAIKGESFLWISDLSAPDSVFGVHILPILMTIISLLNVWIVAKDRGARIQGIIIAIIFLVLLYRMPSALVLYWTTNMTFSLIRAICNSSLTLLSREFGKSSLDRPQLSHSNFPAQPTNLTQDIRIAEYVDSNTNNSKNSSLREFASANSWQSKDSPSLAEGVRGWVKLSNFFIFRKPLKIAVITLTAILAIGLSITFSLMLYAKDNVQIANLTSVEQGQARINFSKFDFLLRSKSIAKVDLVNIEWDKSMDISNIEVLSVVNRYVHYGSSKTLTKSGDYVGQISYTMDFTPLLKNLLSYYFAILGAVLGIYLLICVILRFQAYNESDAQTYHKIANYAILCIAFLICVFTPYQLYNTDITQFDSTQTYSTLSALFGAFALVSFVVIYATSFIPKRFSNFVAFILSVILFSGIVYSFILVGDYSAMDGLVFKQAPFDDSQSKLAQIAVFAVVIVLSIITVTLTLKKLFRVWQIILLTLCIVSGINVYDIFSKKLDSQKYQSNDNLNQIPYGDKLLSYSKTQKNIVVFMLDAFSGSHTPYILEQFPHFKEQLDGFVLFPNTTTTSNATVHSISTLIAGEYASAYNMNKRDNKLADQIKDAFESIGSEFVDNNYEVGIVLSLLDGEYSKLSNQQFVSLGFEFEYATTPILLKQINQKEEFTPFEVSALVSFGLFKFVPLDELKKRIYKNGNWLFSSYNSNSTGIIGHSSTFYAFTHFGNTNASKPTFKFLHSLMTHTNYGMYFKNNECHFFDEKTALDENSNIKEMYFTNENYQDEGVKRAYYQHYDTEACALSYLNNYILWLKQMNIYDNTQIFVVSDHAGEDSINIPINSNPDTLFLFKDFGAKGALKIDNRLMANYDISSIFCENLPNGCPNVPPNILKNYPQNREIIHLIMSGFLLKKHKPNRWVISKAYKVKDNIYDPKNWTDITNTSDITNVKK